MLADLAKAVLAVPSNLALLSTGIETGADLAFELEATFGEAIEPPPE